HEEQATEAVEQVPPLVHLLAVAVDDADGDDRREPVEGVEVVDLTALGADHDRAEHGLGADRELGRDGEPPQCPVPEGLDPVGREGPAAGERVRDDDDPRQADVRAEDAHGDGWFGWSVASAGWRPTRELDRPEIALPGRPSPTS